MPLRSNMAKVIVNLGHKSEFYVDGYPITLAEGVNGDVMLSPDSFDVYGTESQISYTFVDGASLSMNIVNDTSQQVIYDLSTGQDPYPTTPSMRGYYPSETVRCSVLENVLNTDSDGYDMVVFRDNWAAVAKNPAGGPRERGRISVDGRCEPPITMYAPSGVRIAGVTDVVALSTGTTSVSGATAQLTGAGTGTGSLLNPIAIPAAPGLKSIITYALCVEVQCRNGLGTAGTTVLRSAHIPITTTMVSSAGVVTILPADLSPFGLVLAGASAGTSASDGKVTHAFVTYVAKPGNPSATTKYLIGNGITTKAKYELSA